MELHWKRKRVEERPWWHFHWQNLNEKAGDKLGSPLKHGRAWLRLGDGQLNWSWHLCLDACALGVQVGGEEEFGFHFRIGVPLVGSLFVTVAEFGPVKWLAKALLPKTDDPRRPWAGGLHGYRNTRELEVYVYDWSLWWTMWRHPMAGWSREVSRFREGNWHPLDTFLGKSKVEVRTLEEREVEVPMPERAYTAQAKLELVTRKRPRWFAKSWLRTDIELPSKGGIPVPGKGENSWDCDDDACFGSTVSARSIEEGIGELVASCLKTRRERGAPANWAKRGGVAA